MVLLHMKIYIFHILKCNICTYITLAYGKDCYCISFLHTYDFLLVDCKTTFVSSKSRLI